MNNIKLPVAIELIVDDVGWHNGADQRNINLPARSGLPRFHHTDDIKALNAIGKGLDMKITCSLVLGDWDKKNRLRGVPHITHDVEGWDAAAAIDPDYTKAYFNALEESEYLDYCLHGLMHSYYSNGKLVTARQYYPDNVDEHGNKTGGFSWLPAEEFENMVKLFFDIFNDWGFKKDVLTFASPSGCFGTPTDKGNIEYARVLRKYGLLYWGNGWVNHDKYVDTIEGMIISKGACIVPWNAYDVDPSYLEITTDPEKIGTHIGAHLANFIRYNHEKNFEYVDAWIDYFKRQAEVFGTMLARDTAFSCSQTLYSRFAKTEKTDGRYIIDLSDVDRQYAIGKKNEFYVSLKNGTEPSSCEGGRISLYETKASFKTYKIERDGTSIVKISV